MVLSIRDAKNNDFDLREKAVWRGRHMTWKLSVPGPCAVCRGTCRDTWGTWESQDVHPRESRLFLCFCMRKREKKYTLLVKILHCTERYRVKVTPIFFHLSFLPSSYVDT